jgi:GWxTD domain-containing protein
MTRYIFRSQRTNDTSMPTLSRRSRPVFDRSCASLLLLVAAACGGGRAGADPGGTPGLSRDTRNISFDPAPLYRQMGLIARGLPFPVVGRIGYFGSASPDTTHVVLGLSFSSTSLSFAREADDRFRATYTFSLAVDNEQGRVRAEESTETVIVGTFRETSRTDENILFQEIVDLAPGRHRLTFSIRDVGSQRSVQESIDLEVPRLGTGTLSTPLPVNEVAPRAARATVPLLLTRPRATVVFGRDSTIPVYVESYGSDDTALQLIVRNESRRVIWSQAVPVTAQSGLSSGVVEVPVGQLGIGVAQLSFVREGGSDTTSSYVFVGFGDDLPVARFEDMLQFLRHFATNARLTALRAAAEEDRPAAWASFLRETDSIPETPVHEDLLDYFARLVRANNRFREEGVPGWMSDRGKVFIVLGEPDQVLEPSATDFQRNRQQLWDYRERGLQLVFYDQTGTGRWHLTQTSEVRFESEYRRQLR